MANHNFSQLSDFEQRILHKSLSMKFDDSSKLLDSILEGQPEHQKIKQVCAKLHVDLVERLDRVINNLDMSKREFIELALIEALDKAEEIFNDVEPFAGHYTDEAA